jgi:hypothetical protein
MLPFEAGRTWALSFKPSAAKKGSLASRGLATSLLAAPYDRFGRMPHHVAKKAHGIALTGISQSFGAKLRPWPQVGLKCLKQPATDLAQAARPGPARPLVLPRPWYWAVNSSALPVSHSWQPDS